MDFFVDFEGSLETVFDFLDFLDFLFEVEAAFARDGERFAVRLRLRPAAVALVGALVSSGELSLASVGDLSSAAVTLEAALVSGGDLSLASRGDLGSAAM